MKKQNGIEKGENGNSSRKAKSDCNQIDERKVKRMKQEDAKNDPSNNDGILSEIISSNVLEKVGDIAKDYERNSKPFPHNVVKDLFVDGFLGKHNIHTVCI